MEVVSNLSMLAFLAAFTRFFSRRGYSRDMYSDIGANFVGTSKILGLMFKRCEKFQTAL